MSFQVAFPGSGDQVAKGNLEIMGILLEAKASLKIKNENGEHALSLAVASGNIEAVKPSADPTPGSPYQAVTTMPMIASQGLAPEGRPGKSVSSAEILQSRERISCCGNCFGLRWRRRLGKKAG